MLVIEVYDTGIGIKQENLKNLFKLFSKLEDKCQINKEGTGLGLYICRQLVDQMEGTIDVESEENKFTHFTIKIPIIEDQN